MPTAKKPPGMAELATLPGLFPDPASPIGADGHRARMRQRLLKAGPDALADHEMLEMILFIALPRRDTKTIARDLLTRFRTFTGVIGAPEIELRSIEGVGEAGAAAIKLVQAAALRMMQHNLSTQPVLSTWDRLTDYLTAAMGNERTEQFRVLFLDGRNKLIADEIQGRGSINHAPAYPREVVRRCLELHATAVILAHNHPSGDPAPSREDVALTAEIVALRPRWASPCTTISSSAAVNGSVFAPKTCFRDPTAHALPQPLHPAPTLHRRIEPNDGKIEQ